MATTTSVVGVIAEGFGPRWGLAPTGAGAAGPLTLRAAFRLLKAETILLPMWNDVLVCLDSPLVMTASTSVVGVISECLSPGRIGAPSTASVRWSLALRAAFSFLKADSEAILSPALGHPADNKREEDEQGLVGHVERESGKD